MKDPLLLPSPICDVYHWLRIAHLDAQPTRHVAQIWYRGMWLRIERRHEPHRVIPVATWHHFEVEYDGSDWMIFRREYGHEELLLSTDNDWKAMVFLWDAMNATRIDPVPPYVPPTRSRRQGLRLVK